METEWQLQERLTKKWLRNGIVLDGVKLLLASWEVMVPSWRINDFRKHWNEPSIDFLFLDVKGGVWLMELKRWVKTPRDTWAVLCQVTHRTVCIERTFSTENLELAYERAHSGAHGRHAGGFPQVSLLNCHQQFFDLSAPLELDSVGQNFHRVVCAKEFSANWERVQGQFEHKNISEVQNLIKNTYKITNSAREFQRFMNLTQEDWGTVNGDSVSKWVVR